MEQCCPTTRKTQRQACVLQGVLRLPSSHDSNITERRMRLSEVIYMFYAKIGDRRCHARNAKKGEHYTCPVCGGEVIPRQGAVKAWHFSHVIPCMDNWNHDMSDWHREWQDKFPPQCQETIVEKDGVKHRADVLVDDTVIEFQHSPISADEVNKRNAF